MPWGQLAGLALGAGASLLSNRSSKRNEPSKAAGRHLEMVPGAAKPYYDPYITAGRHADINLPYMNAAYEGVYKDPHIDRNALPNQYEQMAHNPTAFMEALMQGYNPSTGYKFKQKQMMDAMRNSASSGGFAGTPYDQQQQAETTQGLLGSDMQQYLENALGISQAGLQGKENRLLGYERALQSSIANKAREGERGYEASLLFGDLLANNRGAQAGNAYTGAVNRGNASQNNIGNWANLGGHAIRMFGGIKGSGGGAPAGGYGSGHYF